MNRVDPRERGLIGAAWYAGYLARAAAAGVEAVTLAATHGPSGIVFAKQPHAQPWFDEAGAKVYPHYHVIAGHAALSGDVLAATSSDARAVQALAVGGKGGTALWLSNLTAAEQSRAHHRRSRHGPGAHARRGHVRGRLPRSRLARTCRARTPVEAGSLTLKPYAVAEIKFD